MNLRRIAAIVLRQIYLLRGSPSRILPMFAWVAIDIVLWGFITRYLGGLTGGEEHRVDGEESAEHQHGVCAGPVELPPEHHHGQHAGA